MECQSTQDILEGKECVELLYVEKFVKGNTTTQLYHSNCSLIYCCKGTTPCRCTAEDVPHAAAVIFEAKVSIRAYCQQGLEQDFHSAKTGNRLFSQRCNLKTILKTNHQLQCSISLSHCPAFPCALVIFLLVVLLVQLLTRRQLCLIHLCHWRHLLLSRIYFNSKIGRRLHPSEHAF